MATPGVLKPLAFNFEGDKHAAEMLRAKKKRAEEDKKHSCQPKAGPSFKKRQHKAKAKSGNNSNKKRRKGKGDKPAKKDAANADSGKYVTYFLSCRPKQT